MAEQALTVKQAAFVEAYLANGGDAANAAREAGYSENVSRAACREVLSSPAVQIEVSRQLHELRGRSIRRLEAGTDAMLDILWGLAHDEDAPAGVRQRCADSWLDRSGHPRKAASDLSIDSRRGSDLEAFLAGD